MSEEITEFLKQLLSLPGLSGYEKPAAGIITEKWGPLTDELHISRLGSVNALRRGTAAEPRPRILLAAHMDAIGFMVSQVVEGFLRVTNIGGADDRILPGQLVTVHGRRDLPGVFLQPPDWLLPPKIRNRPVPRGHLFVDTGLTPAEVNRLVRVGDLVSFATQPMELSGNTLAGHSLDDRAAVAAITACLQELQQTRHEWDVWAVATVQEEVTYAGAYTSPFTIRPDISVAIDVTFARGPGTPADYRSFPLGRGVVLGMGPNIHPAIHAAFKQTAERLEVPYSVEPSTNPAGTDGYAMQVVAGGIPNMVIGIPLRYMHTPVEVVSMKDVVRAGHLLAGFITRLEAGFKEKIRWED